MLTNAILEKPIPFTLNGRYFFLYQPSLGVSLLAGQLLQQLQINPQLYSTNKQMEMLRVCIDQRDIVLRIIALHTFSYRSDVLREDRLASRIKELEKLEAADVATLLVAILSWDGRQEEFVKHFKLDRERKTREKIHPQVCDGSALCRATWGSSPSTHGAKRTTPYRPRGERRSEKAPARCGQILPQSKAEAKGHPEKIRRRVPLYPQETASRLSNYRAKIRASPHSAKGRGGTHQGQRAI